MLRPTAMWLALAVAATFLAAPLAADDSTQPQTLPTPSALPPPASTDIGPPGDIVVPNPEDVVPTDQPAARGRRGAGVGDLQIRTPHADVRVGEGEGGRRVHVQAPFADVRVDSQNGIDVRTPIGPIRIGGRGGLNLRELGDRLGVRVEEDGVVVDPADALPRRGTSPQGAVLGVQLRDDDGIRIASVREGSPADIANLTVGDRIVSMNGYVFETADAMSAEVARMSPGDRVQLTIERDGRLYRAGALLEARR